MKDNFDDIGYLLNKIGTAVCAELGLLPQISQCHVTTGSKDEVVSVSTYHSATSPSNYTKTFPPLLSDLRVTFGQKQMPNSVFEYAAHQLLSSVEAISY